MPEEQLRRFGVVLRSYSEPRLDTSGTSPVANLMFTIMTGFAEFERSLIAERVRAGMARAKKQGKPIGRPPPDAHLSEEERVKALMEIGPGGPGAGGANAGILPVKYAKAASTPFKVDIAAGLNDLNPFRMEGPPLKK